MIFSELLLIMYSVVIRIHNVTMVTQLKQWVYSLSYDCTLITIAMEINNRLMIGTYEKNYLSSLFTEFM